MTAKAATDSFPRLLADKPAPAKDSHPSRQGKKPLHLYVEPAAHKQLRQIALDNNTTVSELMRKALNQLFDEYGGEQIA